jgi:hypothetical protein
LIHQLEGENPTLKPASFWTVPGRHVSRETEHGVDERGLDLLTEVGVVQLGDKGSAVKEERKEEEARRRVSLRNLIAKRLEA